MLTYKLNLTPRLGGSKSDGNAVSTFCKTQFAHWAISGAPRPSFEFERLSRSPSQCSGSGSRARARGLSGSGSGSRAQSSGIRRIECAGIVH